MGLAIGFSPAAQTFLTVLSCFVASRVEGSRVPSPPSYERSRRVVFRLADFDEDGMLTLEERMLKWHRIKEWGKLFDMNFELRLVHHEPRKLQDRPPALLSAKATRRLQSGKMNVEDFIAISTEALWQTVEAAGEDADKLRAKSQALLSLHLWDQAATAMRSALSKAGSLTIDAVYQNMNHLQLLGRYEEAAWIAKFLRKAYKVPQKVLKAARALAKNLQKAKATARGLVPPPDEYGNATYLKAVRSWPASDCPTADARSTTSLLQAATAGKPLLLKKARLLPDIHAWADRLEQQSDLIEFFSVSASGVFFDVRNSSAVGTSGRLVASEPPQVSLKLGDMKAAASLRDARLYMMDRIIAHMPGFEDLVPESIGIAKELNMSSASLWLAIGGGTVSRTHYDRTHNVIAQVHGSKDVYLWRPTDSNRLRYGALPKEEQRFECCPPTFSSVGSAADTQPTTMPVADVREALDDDEFQNALPLHCHVEPGDSLFLPQYWHHLVVSHPGEAQECEVCSEVANLAVSLRFLGHRPVDYTEYAYCSLMVERGDCNTASSAFVTSLCPRACMWKDAITAAVDEPSAEENHQSRMEL
eukprot:TRINITY_DN17927_c0_g1_i2.p1 TRINITY_DN17927_c0_g1~~TRINITY_DN17927_c0_g1_i2.p1  ORF type:complete len:588 (-),score=87.65 TRINITY_DN17927_c0_g1_i2:1054-2817(-)